MLFRSELKASALHDKAMTEVVDQTLAGLNFITTRDRIEIFEEYVNVVKTVYSAKSYFDRVLRVARLLKPAKSKHKPRLFEWVRNIRGFVSVCVTLTADKSTRYLFWRNLYLTWRKGWVVFEHVVRLSGIYIHFRNQIAYLEKAIGKQIDEQKLLAPHVRQVKRSA